MILETGTNRMEAKLSAYVRLLVTIFEGDGVIDISGLKDIVDSVLLTLSPVERQFLTLRFGLSSGNILSSREIATRRKTTPRRVDKHVSKALRKLGHPSRRKKLIPFICATAPKKSELEEASRYEVVGQHVFKARWGLLPDKVWDGLLSDYDTRLVRWLRVELVTRVVGLTEKFNDANGRHYFGYSSAGTPDSLYIYVQQRKLVVDVKLGPERAGLLRSLGFTVSLRRNWQRRAGWLTGWDIPYYLGWEKRQAILEIMLEAL